MDGFCGNDNSERLEKNDLVLITYQIVQSIANRVVELVALLKAVYFF